MMLVPRVPSLLPSFASARPVAQVRRHRIRVVGRSGGPAHSSGRPEEPQEVPRLRRGDFVDAPRGRRTRLYPGRVAGVKVVRMGGGDDGGGDEDELAYTIE